MSDRCENCGKSGNTKKCGACSSVRYCGRECQAANWPVHKPKCKKGGSKELIILSEDRANTFSGIWPSILPELRKKANVLHTDVRHLGATLKDHPNLVVIVLDEHIGGKQKAVPIELLRDYVNRGGTAVFCGNFPGGIAMDDLDSLWARWNLPWTHGSYHRETFQLNLRCNVLPASLHQLPPTYNVKAMGLRVPPTHMLYYEDQDPVKVDSAPVVFQKYGEGYVGYIGDVNFEDKSLDILYFMARINAEITDHVD
eukprot:TRINITY_DN4004_c0_g1_i1.p1 TRINITY_DN4004_c0_g1~~TRINITY_DN4004_c0_g1_i1.p1  ORF type:complete len:263 (+),score=7.41 TRINITY_DN4004_c0_g1_i1:25-789(+)